MCLSQRYKQNGGGKGVVVELAENAGRDEEFPERLVRIPCSNPPHVFLALFLTLGTPFRSPGTVFDS